MNNLNPMKIVDYEDFFKSPERFEVLEAEYDDFSFRVVFSPLVGLFCDILNAKERYDIVKKEYDNDPELRDFEPVLILYYSPIIDWVCLDKEIYLSLGFRHRDGNMYADYTALFKNDNELEIYFEDDAKDDIRKLANLLFLAKTEMTCYEAMLEDDLFDLLKEDKYDVRRLQRLSRQALDKLRKLAMEKQL